MIIIDAVLDAWGNAALVALICALGMMKLPHGLYREQARQVTSKIEVTDIEVGAGL